MADDAAIHRRRFWLGEYDAVAVARMRIAFGAIVLWDLLERLRDFHTFYTDRGLVTAADHAGLAGGVESWSILHVVSSPGGVAVLWAIAIAAFVGLTVGLYTRACNLVGWLLLLSIQRHIPYILDGADLVERVIGFWLLFVDSGAALSLDVRFGRRRPALTVPAFPVRLVQLQLAAIYLFTALYKINDVWLGGTAMMRVLHMHEFVRPWSLPLVHYPTLLRLLTYVVPPTEITIALLLVTPWRATRRLALVAAYGLHVGILVLLRVGLFSPVMMCTLLIFVARPAPPSAEAASYARLHLADRLAGVLLLMALSMQALVFAKRDSGLPAVFTAPLGALALAQDWTMFDRPFATDYEWHGTGHFADGSTRDLSAAFPEVFDSPTSFTYARWLKLRGRLSQPRVRELVGHYVCRRYNASAKVRLRSFELLLVERDAMGRAPPRTLQPPRVVSEQACEAASRDGGGARR